MSGEDDLNMKKRYLFPIVWVMLLALTYILPILFPVTYVLSIPSIEIVNPISRALNGPTDTTYLVVLGTIIQFFIIGYLWDIIAENLRRGKYKPQ